jgi:hypothetical protein
VHRPRRATLVGLVALCVSLAFLIFAAVPALALQTHVFKASIAGSGTNALSSPADVAVDNSAGLSSGDIYVADTGHSRIVKFDATGNFLLMFGKEVNKSKVEEAGSTAAEQNVCTAASGNVCQAGVASSSPGGFITPRFVAVDGSTGLSAGHIYVADTGDKTISKFDEAGHLTETWGTGGQLGGFGFPSGIAVDHSGDFFVEDESNVGKLFRYNQGGTLVGEIAYPRGVTPTGIAVDSEDNFYKVDGEPEVTKFTITGEPFSFEWVAGPSTGLTVDPSNDQFYSDEAGSIISRYAKNCTPVCSPLDSFGKELLSGAQGVTVDGASGNVYVADTSSNEIDSFVSAVVPDVTTSAASNPGSKSISVSGSVDPAGGGSVTSCQFEYVTAAAFQAHAYSGAASKECTPTTPYSEPKAVSANLTGLLPNTVYRYRLSARNSSGAGTGSSLTFKTEEAVAAVTTLPAANIQKASATLRGSYKGEGLATEYHFEYGPGNCATSSCTVAPIPDANNGTGTGLQEVSTPISGLEGGKTYHYRLVAKNANGEGIGQDETFTTADAVTSVKTEPATNVTNTSMEFNGSYVGDGNDTKYFFQYGADTSYGLSTPVVDNLSGTGTQHVSASITGLQSNFVYHFRLVAVNSLGTTYGADEVAGETPSAPTVNGVSSAELTPTTALLKAVVNPEGFATEYHFEYGTSTEYGSSIPVPNGEVTPPNAKTDRPIEVELTNLTAHAVYHFRLIVTNKWGTTTTEDQSFNFFPPSCPNENVRQQTQTNYLPDCRAYELVSPGNAAGTQLHPGGPNTGHASSPSRFSFVGLFGTLPNAGGSPINGNGDLYVATRTDTGWVSRYVGLPSTEAAVDGGPPQGLPGSQGLPGAFIESNSRSGLSNGGTPVTQIQNNVLTDPNMDKFLDWNDGNLSIGLGNSSDYQNPTPMGSSAPYVWAADGSSLGRWPTNLASVPDGLHTHLNSKEETVQVQDGGEHALDCPAVNTSGNINFSSIVRNFCSGDVTASEDLSHFVFASEWNKFAPGGTLNAPGSVYDNNTTTGEVVVASKTPNNEPIPKEPTDPASNPLEIPAVSSDGSHILMAASVTSPCGSSPCETPPCSIGEVAGRCPMPPSHLYMRVDNALTYDVSQGHGVTYIGMAEGGSKVYFTSEEQLTGEDHDTSADLYMWSEATNSLKLISLGNSGTGNSDSCNASFTTKCNVAFFEPHQPSCTLPGGVGGNCTSDNFIASKNGDIYFFSPEQLDGSFGLPNQPNLFDYRNGHVQYVATFTSGPFCTLSRFSGCSNSAIVRMEVSPDDSHMALLTASQLTQYGTAGHLEMYAYGPSTRNIQCVSCIPSGTPPASNVLASQDGPFMTDDGRTFFSTEDALVHADTNQGVDVYEYVEGRPQLITPGTGETLQPAETTESQPGLVGVSANGTDVYIATYGTLVSQDHNGLFLKFYDARAGGGFPAPAPPPPCEAADECHGPGSTTPPSLQTESVARLTGGNVVASNHKKKHHHVKKRRRHSHRAAHRQQGVRKAGGSR